MRARLHPILRFSCSELRLETSVRIGEASGRSSTDATKRFTCCCCIGVIYLVLGLSLRPNNELAIKRASSYQSL